MYKDIKNTVKKNNGAQSETLGKIGARFNFQYSDIAQ